VRVVVARRHVLDRSFFAGFFIAHIHSGHGFGLRHSGFLSSGTLSAGRAVAWHGDEQYRDDEDGGENHGGFCGEMKQRSTG
jgi:hypothetical protein